MNSNLRSYTFLKSIKHFIQMILIFASSRKTLEVGKKYWFTLFNNPNNTTPLKIFESIYAHIKKIMNPTKNDNILEVGFGGGELTYLFYREGFKVKGFDSCKSAVNKAGKKFGTHLFYLDDLLNMKTQEKFSKIFLNDLFLCIHPAHYETVLKNLYRITKENGTVYLFNNPDYSKRHIFYSQFRTRTKILIIVTFFIPVYKTHFPGFWVKTQKVKKAAIKAGFSKIETVDSWSTHRTHLILYK